MKSQKGTPELVDDKPQEVKADLRKFRNVVALIKKAVDTLRGINIEVSDDIEGAQKTLKEALIVKNKIEEKRKQLKQPFLDAGAKIDAHAKELAKDIPGAIQEVKDKILKFEEAAEKLRLAAIRDARKKQLTDLGFAEMPEQKTFVNGDITISNILMTVPDDNWNLVIQDLENRLEQRRLNALKVHQESLEDVTAFGSDEEIEQAKAAIENLSVPVQKWSTGGAVPAYNIDAPSDIKGITNKWTFDILDSTLVPKEYMTIDEAKIREAIKQGTRMIPGVNIYQKKSLTIK